MSEHAPQQQHELLTEQKTQVDYETIVENEDHRVIALTATDYKGNKTSFITLGGDRDTEKAEQIIAAGYPCDMVPSQGDNFTDDEADFAHNQLGFSGGRIKHPFRFQLKEYDREKDHKVVFFEPTAQSLIDVMRMAGHDSEELRSARLDAKHGRPNEIVTAIDVMLAESVPKIIIPPSFK